MHYIYIYRIYNKLKKELKREPIIWLPFDTEDSEYVKFCEKHNFHYVNSHIWNNQDFFEYEPEKWDIAISNPPFSKKLDIFKRLNSFGKPWAMLTNIMCLNYQEIGHYFADNPCQLLIVDKRVSFDGSPSSFNSSYICNHFLPKDLIFIHIDHNNAKNNFVPSSMFIRNKIKKRGKNE